VVSSGYRCSNHPIEQAKDNPGAHAKGKAVDIRVAGEDAIDLIVVAGLNGIRRIGVKQKGDWSSRFIHLDKDDDLPNAIWSY
jgi:zinc D-Ala-D-Ala carboxypeptidase